MPIQNASPTANSKMALASIGHHIFQILHFFSLLTQLDIVDQGGNGGVVFLYIVVKTMLLIRKVIWGDISVDSVTLENTFGIDRYRVLYYA